MNNNIIRFAILLVTLVLTQTTFADVKIKSRQSSGGQSSESTTYIKGKRMRSEQNNGGMQMVNITQCDLKRSVKVMPQSQTYMVDSWQTQSVAPTTTTEKTQSATKGGVITTTITTKDTGERKQMFGYTARHIITTMESVSSPDACNANNTKMEIDGWYIDAAFVLNCENDQYVRNYQNLTKNGGCQNRHISKQVGKGKTGYPVLEKTVMFDDNGKENFTMSSEVTELSSATLDAALFDVPGDYREVKDATELYASMSNDSSANNKTKNDYSPKSNSSNTTSLSSDAPAAVTSAIKSLSDPARKKTAWMKEFSAATPTNRIRIG